MLIERLREHTERQPDELALAFPTIAGDAREYRWRDVSAGVANLASRLRATGIRPDEIVLIVAPDPRDQVFAFLAVVQLGAVPSITSYPSVKQSRDSFAGMLEPLAQFCRAQWVVCAPEFEAVIRSLRIPASVVVLDAEIDTRERRAVGVSSAGSDRLFLQFSSGTTGRRKGVAITQSMFASHEKSYAAVIELGGADRVVSWLPLYHDMGLVACFLLPLARGAASIHLSPFAWLRDPASLLTAVAHFRGTLVWLPNFAYHLLTERVAADEIFALGSLRALVNCSEPVRPQAHDLFLERFARAGIDPSRLQACYGMAENVFAVTQTAFGAPPRIDVVDREAFTSAHEAIPAAGRAPHSPDDSRSFRLVSCGTPCVDTEVRIGGADRERIVGDIEIRGSSCFAGYFGTETPSSVFTEDGWFKTGDLGYLADGELFVTGRAKDLLIVRGHNVYPNDVEELTHDVAGCRRGRAVAFGIADDRSGTEQIIVMVETEPGASPEEHIAAQVRERVFDRLGVELADVVVVPPDTLGKSTSGKLSRAHNAALYTERFRPARTAAAHGTDRVTGARTPYEQVLCDIWSDVLGARSIGVATDVLGELGAGSIEMVRAAAALAERQGLEVAPEFFAWHRTIAAQADALEAKRTAQGRIVTLQRSDAEGTVILVHPAGGDAVMSYSHLAKYLAPWRVIGVQDPHLFLDSGHYKTMDEMAADYFDSLREAGAAGPMVIGGWSLGCVTAVRLARKIHEQWGLTPTVLLLEPLPFLGAGARAATAVIDVTLRLALRGALRAPKVGRALFHRRLFRRPLDRLGLVGCFLGNQVDPRRLVEFALPELDAHPGSQRRDPEATWTELQRFIGRAEPSLIMPGKNARHTVHRFRVWRTHLRMLQQALLPAHYYPGPAICLMARGSRGLGSWARVFDQPVCVREYDTTGSRGRSIHDSFLAKENVALYGPDLHALLQGRLAAAAAGGRTAHS